MRKEFYWRVSGAAESGICRKELLILTSFIYITVLKVFFFAGHKESSDRRKNIANNKEDGNGFHR